MSEKKRVPRQDCIVINGKLCAPGTVIKVSEEWIRNHYEPKKDEYKVELFVKMGFITFDIQPLTYYIDYNGKEQPNDDFGYVFAKAVYWEYMYHMEDRCYFRPVINPYITRQDCYFGSRGNDDFPQMSSCMSGPARKRLLTFDDNNLFPDYVNIDKFLAMRTSPYKMMPYMVRYEYLQNAIVELVDPIEWNIKDNPNLPDDQIGSVMLGWFVYILLMLASIIFNDRWFLWIMFTVFWVFIRQMLVNQASGY